MVSISFRKSSHSLNRRSLANGIASVNATVWIVECAPPSILGGMAALQEFTMAVGKLSLYAFSLLS